jgi:hypothetical protein
VISKEKLDDSPQKMVMMLHISMKAVGCASKEFQLSA